MEIAKENSKEEKDDWESRYGNRTMDSRSIYASIVIAILVMLLLIFF